jgi:hypothetical protein
MHVGVQVNHFCSILTMHEFPREILVKPHHYKILGQFFQRTDGLTGMTKLIFAFYKLCEKRLANPFFFFLETVSGFGKGWRERNMLYWSR